MERSGGGGGGGGVDGSGGDRERAGGGGGKGGVGRGRDGGGGGNDDSQSQQHHRRQQHSRQQYPHQRQRWMPANQGGTVQSGHGEHSQSGHGEHSQSGYGRGWGEPPKGGYSGGSGGALGGPDDHGGFNQSSRTSSWVERPRGGYSGGGRRGIGGPDDHGGFSQSNRSSGWVEPPRGGNSGGSGIGVRDGGFSRSSRSSGWMEPLRGHGGGSGSGSGSGPLKGKGPTFPTATSTVPRKSDYHESKPLRNLVGPNFQSQDISEKLASPSDTTSKIVPVTRPDKGGKLAIRTDILQVNHFPVSFDPESIIMHYDIDVRPDLPPKDGRPARVTKSNLTLIRNKLFTDNPSQFPLSMTAYDGEKNIFSAVRLPTGKFKVEFSEAEDMKECTYTFTIKLVNELKLSKLKDYLSGKLLSIPRDVLHGMDVVMKENPIRNMISVGRTFHSVESCEADDLGFGITASRGFQRSLKPTFQGLAMCLDYSVLAFRKRLPVIDFLYQHIPGFELRDFRSFRRVAENALKGLKVTVTHRITKQKYMIAGLTKDNTRHITFLAEDPEGKAPQRQVSLVEYFRQKYRDIQYKDIPCLDLGKSNRKNYVPMEFCVLVEGQVYPKEHLDRKAAMLLKKMSLATPSDRQRIIRRMVSAGEGPSGGNVIQNFGMNVDKNMTSVEGRVIGPPELKLSASNGRVMKISVDKEKCHWNLVGRGVVEGKTIERWAILDFSSSDRDRLRPQQFILKLRARCENLGIIMKEPLFCQSATMYTFSTIDMLHGLLEAVNVRANKTCRGQLQILLCVMSRKDPGYKYLKWISETRVGVVTQCCLSTHANKGNDQYLANLALKINAKLGGSNVELIDQLPYFERGDHVMFVGADVNHPGARNTMSPSIAAVVATVNWPAATRYAARVRPQDHRKERIVNFADMCLELVETYARLNEVKPANIVIFRDGVSEGQFDMVLNEELIDLKKSFQSINYNPTITLIVAQKRHQTRLFTRNRGDGSSNGNVSPGTVVDTKIVHPFEFDFYLCSHYGSLGTSKPTHYHVLWDEHGFSSDQLQKLIYNMCYTFARCTKPVSLIPPVYYADLVAYRGRLYYEAVMEGHSPASATSSSSSVASSSLSSAPSFDDRFYKLHADLENIMFFV